MLVEEVAFSSVLSVVFVLPDVLPVEEFELLPEFPEEVFTGACLTQFVNPFGNSYSQSKTGSFISSSVSSFESVVEDDLTI